MTVELDPAGLRTLAERHRLAAEQLSAIAALVRTQRSRTQLDPSDREVARSAPLERLSELEWSIASSGAAISARSSRLTTIATRAEQLAEPSGIDGAVLDIGEFVIGLFHDIGTDVDDVIGDLAGAWTTASDEIDTLLSPFTTPLTPFRTTAPPLPTGPLTHVSEETVHFDVSAFVTVDGGISSTIDRTAQGGYVVTIELESGVAYQPGTGESAHLNGAQTGTQAQVGVGIASGETMTFVFANRAELDAWRRHVNGQLARISPIEMAIRPLDRLLIDAAGPPSSRLVGAGMTVSADASTSAILNLHAGIASQLLAQRDLVNGNNQISVAATIQASAGVSYGLSSVSVDGSAAFHGVVEFQGASPTVLSGTIAAEVGVDADEGALISVLGSKLARQVTEGLADGHRYRIEQTVTGTVNTQSLEEFLQHPVTSGSRTTTVYEVDDDSTSAGATVELGEFGQLGGDVEHHERSFTPVR